MSDKFTSETYKMKNKISVPKVKLVPALIKKDSVKTIERLALNKSTSKICPA